MTTSQVSFSKKASSLNIIRCLQPQQCLGNRPGLPCDFHEWSAGRFQGMATKGLLLTFSSRLSCWQTQSWCVSSTEAAVPPFKRDANLLDFPSVSHESTFQQSTSVVTKMQFDHQRSVILECSVSSYYRCQIFFLRAFQTF